MSVLLHGEPTASDDGFWKSLGVPSEMIEGIVQSVSHHEIWECNLPVFELYQYMATQWHVGMTGRSGMIYSEAYKRMDEIGITSKEERISLMDDLRVMEAETLRKK